MRSNAMPDRYKYFRIEARELLEALGRGVLDIEGGVAPRERAALLLRLAHTLKGAARVVKLASVAQASHELEELLLPFRQSNDPMSRERIDAMLATLTRIQREVARMDVPALEKNERESGARVVPLTEPTDTFDSVRIEVRSIDPLLDSLAEAGAHLAALRGTLDQVRDARRRAHPLAEPLGTAPVDTHSLQEKADALESALATIERNLETGLDHADRELAEAQEHANGLRLLPVRVLFPALERVIRDAAQAVGLNVRLDTSGGDNRLDAHVLSTVSSALFHVARNAVTHGIETEAERIKAGKPSMGRVSLEVSRRGHRVVFAIRDDGRGIDAEGVRRTAVHRGLISREDAERLSPEETVRLIFRGGISTAAQTTEVAGRGIGLDAVRATVAQLNGDVAVETEQGRGTTIEVSVPVSLSSLPALFFESGGQVAAVPLDSVEKTLQLSASDLSRSAEGATWIDGDRTMPFLSLAKARSEGRIQTAIVLRAGGERAAVGVDRLLGTGRVLVKRLPRLLQSFSLADGAALDPGGLPQSVLDPAGLIAAARASRDDANPEPHLRRLPILVVDDSLTTRLMEQSILEAAGYRVELATSAEEALTKAHQRSYALFVVDVEMPGMDGFEFLERAQRDSVLRDTPGILVTSRASPADLRRGLEVGARGHIVKGQFDQKQFLDTIQRLIG